MLSNSEEKLCETFQRMIHKETEIVRENQKIVTEMSHDLRTPITSIMLYTEILKKGKYENEAQLLEYLKKIDQSTSYEAAFGAFVPGFLLSGRRGKIGRTR